MAKYYGGGGGEEEDNDQQGNKLNKHNFCCLNILFTCRTRWRFWNCVQTTHSKIQVNCHIVRGIYFTYRFLYVKSLSFIRCNFKTCYPVFFKTIFSFPLFICSYKIFIFIFFSLQPFTYFKTKEKKKKKGPMTIRLELKC